MKAFITGGAGYIGSHTCSALAKTGHELVIYDNLSTGHKSFARYGRFIHGDIADTQKLRAVLREFEPDVVIHFAAHAYVGESVLNPGKYFHNNVAGTLSLLEAMRDENIRNIVVSGTCAVYGQPEKMPISEDTPTLPINPYGASKLFMERMLADFQLAHRISWVSLRYFNAAGCAANGEIGELHNPETHVIPRAVLAALGIFSKICIFGTDYPTKDGTCIRDYIHVDDLASAHILAASSLIAGGESLALNLGTGVGTSVMDIIKGLEKIAGRHIPYDIGERRPGDPPTLMADATKARKILGWHPRKDLEEMLTSTWHFLQNHQTFFTSK